MPGNLGSLWLAPGVDLMESSTVIQVFFHPMQHVHSHQKDVVSYVIMKNNWSQPGFEPISSPSCDNTKRANYNLKILNETKQC